LIIIPISHNPSNLPTRGNTEPVWTSNIKITLHEGSTITNNLDMVANGTCHGCRALSSRASIVPTTDSPMIFAVGPSRVLSSDDLDARIQRHIGYGQFTIDLLHASGPSSFLALPTPSNVTSHAVMAAGSPTEDGGSKASTVHGVLYAIVALAIAPFDSLVAATTANKTGRWVWLQGISGALYFAFVLGAMVPGVIVSRELVLVCLSSSYPVEFGKELVVDLVGRADTEVPHRTPGSGAAHHCAYDYHGRLGRRPILHQTIGQAAQPGAA
jgi:hypothetical protein